MERLLLDLSINVTSMFRDPTFYAAFREKVVPLLRTYPFTRIWVAGCSTGEEVYSLAIMLTEEGLYDRSRIYATDINEAVLARAREGVFPLDRMQEYTDNYIRAGGKRSFSEYYLAKYEGALFERTLTENVVWAPHNLVQDRLFNTFNVILCRNVMIYFDRPLQNRVHQLFHDSLERFGILALGHKESIRFTGFEDSLRGARRLREALPADPMSHDLVAIGASWGGLDAVRTLLGGLPAELDAAVVIAQHRAPESHPTAFRDLLGAVTRAQGARSRRQGRAARGHGLRRAARLPPARRARQRSRSRSTSRCSTRARRSTFSCRRRPRHTASAASASS